MYVYHSIEEVPEIPNCIITQGMFDGVHRGHQIILEEVIKLANQCNGESLVITYWPHPRYIFGISPEELPLLTSLEEKISLIESCGIDNILVIHFTKEFAQMTMHEFVEDILVKKLHVHTFVVGHDQRIGREREGDYEHISLEAKHFGFTTTQVPQKEFDGVTPSSGLIRDLLIKGDVEQAAQYLGREYSLSGVLQSDGRFELHDSELFKLIPKEGTYKVRILAGKKYQGQFTVLDRTKREMHLMIHDSAEVSNCIIKLLKRDIV